MSVGTPDRLPEPPTFVELAADPVRWRLLSALADSDLRVSELCARSGIAQSLVSYHLARLRAAYLVRARRSSADGREVYYAIDLERCGESLAEGGTALHPGLRLVSPPTKVPGRRAGDERARVLFLCTGNSARSQMAEALLEKVAGRAVSVVSAGSHPKPVHPNAVRVLLTRGIDIGSRPSKHMDTFTAERFNYVVSLCDRVREVCPEFPGHPHTIHWSVPDPAREGNNDQETYPAFERTLAELSSRIRFFVEIIEHDRAAR